MANDKSFFQSRFDFSFTAFVTPKLIKVLYGISLFFIAIGVIVVVVGGFQRGIGGGLLALLILGPLYGLLLTILARIYMELMIAIFRIVELLSELVDQGRSNS